MTPEEKRDAMYKRLSRFNLANPTVRKVMIAIVCIIIFGIIIWIGGHKEPPYTEMP